MFITGPRQQQKNSKNSDSFEASGVLIRSSSSPGNQLWVSEQVLARGCAHSRVLEENRRHLGATAPLWCAGASLFL